MDYITPQLLPGRLTDCAAAVLRTVYLAVVWMPRPCDLNGDQLRALLALRNAGYIEFAAFGGYRIKANEYTVGGVEKPTPPTDVKALLIAAGLPSERIKRVLPTSGAWLRPGDGAQWSIVLDRAGNLGNVDKSAFTEWIADGALIIVRVKVA